MNLPDAPIALRPRSTVSRTTSPDTKLGHLAAGKLFAPAGCANAKELRQIEKQEFSLTVAA